MRPAIQSAQPPVKLTTIAPITPLTLSHLLTLMKLLKLNTAAMLVPSPDLDPLMVNLNRHTVSSLE
jgi:hypothetical protein|uniref:Uncharacterized protein n=1 Tax=Populus trichocarpa TaxID=3694 RepID=A9PEI7_POPTR|nr:unknown [Populus trichocarpa]